MATIIDGKKMANEMRAAIKEQVQALIAQGQQPKMAVVLVGNDPASVAYAKAKKTACEKAGIVYDLHQLPEDSTLEQVQELVRQLNTDVSVHGIMIELPLPKHLDKEAVLPLVDPNKDLDGVTPVNKGRLMAGQDGLFPATPQSCIEIILRSGIKLEGTETVLVGHGETVGKPLTCLLMRHLPTLTICHHMTRDLAAHTRQADLLIVAVGKAGLIRGDMVKPGATVVDVGINEVDGKIVGDVRYDEAEQVAGMITPVPGGVGSVTTAIIMQNLLKAMKLQGK
ncbi:MAG: bifunctional 5,10-methylenetetrahydrofolate dehydrogenase/5,10-methenyltetrahydrofolate cyclohydrolase [Bacillota bacterium]